jgi:hypothetical protein
MCPVAWIDTQICIIKRIFPQDITNRSLDYNYIAREKMQHRKDDD